MWGIFGVICAGIVFYIVGILSIKYDWGLEEGSFIWGTLLFGFGLIFMHTAKDAELVQQAKDILIKGNPYEMVIQYELKDSLYVPADTIFILKEIK